MFGNIQEYPKLFKNYFIYRQQKIELKPMSGVIILLYFVVLLGDFIKVEMRPKYEEIILLSSPRAFLLSTPMENSAVCQL